MGKFRFCRNKIINFVQALFEFSLKLPPDLLQTSAKSHSFSTDGSFLSCCEASIGYLLLSYYTNFHSFQHISFALPASLEMAAHQSRKWYSPATDNLTVARSGGPLVCVSQCKTDELCQGEGCRHDNFQARYCIHADSLGVGC